MDKFMIYHKWYESCIIIYILQFTRRKYGEYISEQGKLSHYSTYLYYSIIEKY